MVIHLSGQPVGCSGTSTPLYLALHQVEFTLPRLLPDERCALTAPFHTYLTCVRRYIFCCTSRQITLPCR